MRSEDPTLGFFIQPVHPPGRRYADVLLEDREAVILADRLGFAEAFIGEHLADTAETITSCLAFITNLADACPRIVFATGVLPLPNYHPVMAAAQIAMVSWRTTRRRLAATRTARTVPMAADPPARGDAIPSSDRHGAG